MYTVVLNITITHLHTVLAKYKIHFFKIRNDLQLQLADCWCLQQRVYECICFA